MSQSDAKGEDGMPQSNVESQEELEILMEHLVLLFKELKQKVSGYKNELMARIVAYQKHPSAELVLSCGSVRGRLGSNDKQFMENEMTVMLFRPPF